jgi:hypothetical protein
MRGDRPGLVDLLSRNAGFKRDAFRRAGRAAESGNERSRCSRTRIGALNRRMLGSLALLLVWPHFVSAGMPSVTLADVPPAIRNVTHTGLTDLARQRLEVISFFLLGMLICAAIIRRVWNGLRRDFPILPRLSYARALGIIVLWGLLFILVLTMISGARELMTPGAWEKNGLTYRLVPSLPPPAESEITVRVEALRRLGEQLLANAKGHGGAFPTAEQAVELGESVWTVPSSSDGRYLYLGGQMADDDSVSWPLPLAYEPGSVGPDRLVLMTDGSVRWMPASELERVLSSREP